MSFGEGREIEIQDDEDRPDISISCGFGDSGDDVSGVINKCLLGNDSLNDHERHQLQQLLCKYGNVFDRPVHPIKDFCFRIQVTDDSPFKVKNYPIPQSIRGEVDETIKNMISEGIIERSVTAYLNPIVVVKKKDGKVRICLDARRINEVVGDKVLVRTPRVSDQPAGLFHKFFPLFSGPFIVEAIPHPNVCLLRDENGLPAGKFNFFNLRPFKE